MENASAASFTNSSNSTDFSPQEEIFESMTLKAVRLAGYAVLFVFGVLGNLMVILAVRKPRMKTVTNVLIANLGLADILVSLFNIPTVVTYAHLWHWPFGLVLCKVLSFLQGWTLSASILTLLAIAIDRYWHIVLFRRRQMKLNEAFKAIIVIWLSSVIVPSPLLIFSKTISFGAGEEKVVFCEEIWPDMTSRQVYTMVVFLVLYLCPLALISWLYVLIAVWLRSMPAVPSSLTANKHQVHKRVIRMLVTVVALFALCWLPYHVVFIYVDYGSPSRSDVLVSAILFSQWLVFASSACNPCVYAVMNENYRREFGTMLSFCAGRKRSRRRYSNDVTSRQRTATTSSVMFVTSL
ncbi:neuropeptide FF receptor 2 [Nematostella vectensis]|uniref:neuropeptide FF receptor 2 n=1 Tax=Nematostella vectensis TaxID=45351 RepID=UPI0020778236|nr:neuropeptide FF receptor 2 [Nematostella vectensis]